MTEEQNGFMKERSTVDQLLSLTSIVDSKLTKNAETFAAFIDFKNAYGTVNRSLLWSRLAEMGIHCKMLTAVNLC